MKLSAIKGDVADVAAETIVVNLFQGVENPDGATGAIDAALDGQLTEMIAVGELTGKLGVTTIVHTQGRLPAKRVAIIGLGKREDCDLEAIRRAVGTATRTLISAGLHEWHTIVHGAATIVSDEVTTRDLAQALAEASTLGAYEFDRYRTIKDDNGRRDLASMTIVEADGRKLPAIRRGLDRGAKIAAAVNYTRDIGNMPPNDMTPAKLAAAAQELADEHGLEIEVLAMKELRRLGMGGIIGVGQGSNAGPRMIVLRYHGGRKNDKPTAIVGKAITFDTGGVSIKPSRLMDEMKFDKMGGCAVLGVLKAAALTGLKQNLIGVVAAAENMLGGNAYRPGDILTSYSGKTIEIINTDAEGRLVLADALAWVAEQEPRQIIDVATLTGACVVALGETAAGAFGNQQMVDRLVACGAKSGDRAWPLPLYPEFSEAMKSQVADIKNAGGHWGGASNGAAFLKFFLPDGVRWAHLDIAGTAYVKKTRDYHPVGATGAGVRLLMEYLSH